MGCARGAFSAVFSMLLASCGGSSSDDAGADAVDTTMRDASMEAALDAVTPLDGAAALDADADVSIADVPAPDAVADVGTAGDASGGWQITVYYTPVEQFHGGAPMQVTGCATIECSMGTADLGTYPAEFVQIVQDEGTGRITSGAHAGEYLNWSIDVGYWLDSAPRDARGMMLVPYVSAAADPSIPYDVGFRVTECGVDDTTGGAIDASVCDELRAASWVVRDRFTVGAVGAHVDLYIGEEDRVNFLDTSPRVISTRDAVLTF